MTDEERARAIDFIITAQTKFSADLEAEAEERRAPEAETTARLNVSDCRLDRLERLAKSFVRAGRRARRDLRERTDAVAFDLIRTDEQARRATCPSTTRAKLNGSRKSCPNQRCPPASP